MAGSTSNCSECGFSFAVKSQVEKNKTEFNEVKSATQAFNLAVPYAKYISLGIISIILAIAVIALTAFGVGSFFVWMGSSNFLQTYQDTLSSVKTLLVLASVLAIVASVYSNCGYYVYVLLYSRFLTKNNVNGIRLLEKSFGSADFETMSADTATEIANNIENTIRATILQESIIYKTQEKTRALIQSLVFSIGVIFLCVFVVNNIQLCMETTFILGKNHFEFSMVENWWLFVVSVVVFIVAGILDRKFTKSEKKDVDNWLLKNLPDYVDVYKNKIRGYIDNMLDKIEASDRTR